MAVTTRRSQTNETTDLMATDPNVQTHINRSDPMVEDPDLSTYKPPRVLPSVGQGVTTPLAGFTTHRKQEPLVLIPNRLAWGKKTLSALISTIRKPIMADKHTKDHKRMQFARILIEMEIPNFPDRSFWYLNEYGKLLEQVIEYEWLPVKCKHCAVYGHIMGDCRRIEKPKETPKERKTVEKTVVILSEFVGVKSKEKQVQSHSVSTETSYVAADFNKTKEHWNVRGLNNKDKYDSFADIWRLNKLGVGVLIETKFRGEKLHRQNKDFFATFIYGANTIDNRSDLWLALSKINVAKAWLILSDFNVVFHHKDRNGETLLLLLNLLIPQAGLLKLLPQGVQTGGPRKLEQSFEMSKSLDPSAKAIWCGLNIPKHGFILSQAANMNMLTRDMFSMRSIPSSSMNLVPLMEEFVHPLLKNTLGDCNLEANDWIPEAAQFFFIIVASMEATRDVTRAVLRRVLRGFWFFLYITKLRYCSLHLPTSIFTFFTVVSGVFLSTVMDEFLNTVSTTLALPPDETIVFTYDVGSSSSSPATISLLLKLHTIRPYNHPSLMKTLSGIWSSQCCFPVSVSKHADGMFLVTFGCEGDIKRFIAMEVGDLIKVDKDTIKEGTRPYMCLRILLDVNLPIRRGMNIKFIRMGREFIKWLDFKYERLPDFCFFCRKLDHTKKYRLAFLPKCDELFSEPLCPYNILLRGKEKISKKSHPFQYPHHPTITMVNYQPVNLNLPPQHLSAHSITFLSFLNLNANFTGPFVPPQSTFVIMMPTPMNPNTTNIAPSFTRPNFDISMRSSAFTSYSTDSLIVADISASQMDTLSSALTLLVAGSDKVASVLRSWSSKCFSRAGKEVLLKVVIQAIPTYDMASFRLPIKICKGTEARMAKFWWGSTGCLGKFIGNPGSSVLKARYFPHFSILEVVPGHNPSYSWRRTWDVVKLWLYLDESMVNDILKVPVSGCYGHDDLIWERESFGIFTVKFAYHLAFSQQDLPSSSSFYIAPDPEKLCDIPDVQQVHSTSHNSTTLSAPAQPIELGNFRIFTDAAIDPKCRKYSVGVVVLDACNRVKAGFSTPFTGLVSPAIAEAKAIYQAIQWAQLIKLPVDVLMADCKSIVDKLSSCNWNNSILDDILSNIKNLLSFSPRLAICHVHREYNVIAHKVAKLGLGLDNELVWNGSLPSL
uniref:RNase H type-1 domain-containing protein n=1 Tax=Cannabis sativa TaxID=3483 RepID=A0A803QQN9_CANSA